MAEVGASSRVRICSSSLGGGAGCDGFGSDDGVRVAVADDLQIQVVGGPSAGEHGVQLLPGFLTGDQAVHGVGGDPLGGMDGRRIPQLGGLPDVLGGEPGGELAAGVPDRRSPCRLMWLMVQRSPFFTQSLAERRSRRSLRRVMITSPTLAWFPSAS